LIVAFLRGKSLPIDRLTLPRIGFQAP
jgi:hypothetical protein